ncbi:ring domain-containing protein [Babesia ovata]|uniref:Ring domain-containing protein n=1 Tax=Babesia ovata TaxID=189622 RepID=A0A2H6KBX9_9APIC|nr:ring domain-containing protein [Babesia ovata]GBE60500.1 ring domain-containing protein [Babesia ovata]
MHTRGRQERYRIPSDQLVNFSRYVVRQEIPARSECVTPAPSFRPAQRNLRCYIADVGLPPEELPISRPKLTVDWSMVDLVDLMVDEDNPVTCPICLDESLIAPRVARCGHAFCWLCILKYLNFNKTADKKPCPLCQQSLNRVDLKPVRFQVKQKPTVLTFALLTQEENACTAVLHPDICEMLCGTRVLRPVNQIASSDSLDIQFWDVAYTDQMKLRELLKNDFLALENLALNTQESDGATHDAIVEALSHLNSHGISVANTDMPSFTNDADNVKEAVSHLRNVADSYVYASCSESDPNLEGDGRTKHYCFYQSVDGCKVLLHPMLLKCLWHCCGQRVNRLPLFLANLPVLGLEEIVVSGMMRRRYNWLSHFRMGCKVYLAHVPLESYVPPPKLAEFMRQRQIAMDMKMSKKLQSQEDT